MKNYCVELLWTFNQTRLNRWIFPVENSRTDAAESNGFHRVVVIVKSEKPVRRHIYLKPTHVSMHCSDILGKGYNCSTCFGQSITFQYESLVRAQTGH